MGKPQSKLVERAGIRRRVIGRLQEVLDLCSLAPTTHLLLFMIIVVTVSIASLLVLPHHGRAI